jgi:SH3-like domain-containing protein
MRFDNGKPWKHPSHAVPTGLALWLVGLGIRPIFGRPRQSTDNAVVERSHGVLNGWVETSTCANINELEQRLNRFATIQRERYPVRDGASRMSCYPALLLNSRPYQVQQEINDWRLQRVLDYVATYTFTRTVEKNGRITLMTHEYSLGRVYRSQQVSARLDTQQQSWIIKDRQGEIVATFPALQLNYLTIESLTLTRQHFRAKPDVVSGGA